MRDEPPLYFDRQGERISFDRWGVLHDDEDYRRVGLDVYPSIEDAPDPMHPEALATISTVWIGINHAFLGGPPLIFETMIFGGEFDNHLTRYHSEAAAADGHFRTVEDLRHGRRPWFLIEEDVEVADGE